MPIVPSAPAPKPQLPKIDPVYIAMAEAEVKQQFDQEQISEVPEVDLEDGGKMKAWQYDTESNWDMELNPDMFYGRVRETGSGWGVKQLPGSYVDDEYIKQQPALKELIDKAPSDIEVRRLKKGYHLFPRNDLVS